MEQRTKSALIAAATSLLRAYIRFSPVDAGKAWIWNNVFDKYLGWRPDGPGRIASTPFDFRVHIQLPDMIQEVIYLTGRWEPFITEYFRRTLAPGDTFIDVGANIGYYTLLASREVGRSGRVFSIEGSPSIFERLRSNIALNGASNIEAMHALVGASEGQKPFWIASDSNIGHSTSVEALALNEGMRLEGHVPCRTLLSLVPPKTLFEARLIKIDVEGAERAVLEPLVPHLVEFSKRTVWAVEVSPRFSPGGQADVDWVYDAFCSRGYTAFAIPNDYSIKTHLSKPKSSVLAKLEKAPTDLTDVVFLRA